MSLNINDLCVSISADHPSGTNEEYNALYLQLEELAVGKPTSVMGDSIIDGVDPDWRTLEKNCLKLWETTRDLRVAMYLCIAEFSLNGLKGFSEALSLTEYLVKDLWDDFYPQLDPDDDNDPTERLNIFAMISPMQGSYSDPFMFLSKFRTVRLIEGKKYTLRDLMIVDGELDVVEENLDPQLFKGEMNTVPLNVMQESKALVDKITEQLNGITEAVNAHLPDTSVSFGSLLSELKILQRFYQSHAAAAQAETNPSEEGPESGKEGIAEVRAGASAGIGKRGFFDLAGFVPSNRGEALQMLQKGAEYFQHAEPTSPVPFLVNRAIRMSNMTFLDLLGDIEPGALEKGREIFGIKPESESDSQG